MTPELQRALGINQTPAADLLPYQPRLSFGDHGFSLKTASSRHLGPFPINPFAQAANASTMSVPTSAVYGALRAILDLDWHASSIQVDASLSDIGRRTKTEPLERASSKTLAAAFAMLQEERVSLEADEVARYAVPQLGAADVRGELRDGEVRASIRSMTSSEQFQTLSRVLAGEDPEGVLLALLRSPVAFSSLEKQAKAGWEAAVDARDPEGLKQLQQRRTAIEWAELIVMTVAAVLKPSFEAAWGGAENLWLGTREHRAERLWGFTPSEQSIFQRRLAAA